LTKEIYEQAAETQREKHRNYKNDNAEQQRGSDKDTIKQRNDGDQRSEKQKRSKAAKERREIHKREDKEKKKRERRKKGQQPGTSTTILTSAHLISASDSHPVHRIHEPILPDLRIRHDALRVEPRPDLHDQLLVKAFVSALLIVVLLLEFLSSLLVAMLALGAARTLVLRIALGSDGVFVVALALSPPFLVLFIGVVPGAHVAAAAL
jgi:hypothetical protein